MDFVFTYYKKLPKEMEKYVHELLCICDQEFVPPLSNRTGTQDCNLSSDTKQNAGIDEYMLSLLEQEFIVSVSDNKVVGFLSFRRKPANEAYVSTIIVHPDFRKNSLGRDMYQKLLETLPTSIITTRTWSTNGQSNHLLDKLGFTESKRLKNDRGAGVDTVYFKLER